MSLKRKTGEPSPCLGPVKVEDRSYKGFSFFCENDLYLFEVLARGEFNIKGFQNKTIRQFFPELSSASVSRIFKRLRLHGLIKKVADYF